MKHKRGVRRKEGKEGQRKAEELTKDGGGRRKHKERKRRKG